MPLFWMQLERLTFLPQLFLGAHHLAITSRSSAGSRGRINGCSSTKVQNRACRKAQTASRGAEGHPADRARAAGLGAEHPRELRQWGSAGFTCSNHADWTKAYLKIISLNWSKPSTKKIYPRELFHMLKQTKQWVCTSNRSASVFKHVFKTTYFLYLALTWRATTKILFSLPRGKRRWFARGVNGLHHPFSATLLLQMLSAPQGDVFPPHICSAWIQPWHRLIIRNGITRRLIIHVKWTH